MQPWLHPPVEIHIVLCSEPAGWGFHGESMDLAGIQEMDMTPSYTEQAQPVTLSFFSDILSIYVNINSAIEETIYYDTDMDKLLKGVVHFKKRDFEKHRGLFEGLGRDQKPHTLFIGCADSRVVPSLITKTLPGELFIVRNIANIVPPYRMADEYLATTSAIEYAVQMLNVENIVVCGHSNCGGCASLYQEQNEKLPHTRKVDGTGLFCQGECGVTDL